MTLSISVLLPTYNRAPFIAGAIESALSQTYPVREIVVVDDGSTDDTAEVVARFRDRNVRYIYQENRGISGAMNTAFRAAAGEWVAILNSDDVWLPTILEEEARVVETHPEIGLVYARAQAMDDQGRPLGPLLGAPEKYPGETFKSLLYGDHVCTITVLARRDYVERAGLWDENLIANEDRDLWMRLALVTRFYFLDKVLARFRLHGGNITGAANMERFRRVSLDRIASLDKILARADLPPEARAMRPIAYRNVYMDVGLRWVSVRNWGEAWGAFRRAVVISPQPAATLFRILFLIVFYNFLSKHRWSNALVDAGVRTSRKLGRWMGH